jgi:hypothetical protein
MGYLNLAQTKNKRQTIEVYSNCAKSIQALDDVDWANAMES